MKEQLQKCWECEITGVELQDHHPVPRSRGGKKTIPLCLACHSKAHHENKNMASSKLKKEGIARKKAEAKRKGIPWRWGNPSITKSCQPLGEALRKENAKKYNNHIIELVNKINPNYNMTFSQIAEELNNIGSTTRRGQKWNQKNLQRVLAYGGYKNRKDTKDKHERT